MPHVHAPGLVLQLDPQTLIAHGSTYTWDEEPQLSAQQYFVCVDANAKDAVWVPLFGGPGPGRKGIAAAAKAGDTRWTRSSSFYHAGQACRIGHKGAVAAAKAAYDRSTPKAPNRLLPAHVPARAEFPADDAFRPMAGNLATR